MVVYPAYLNGKKTLAEGRRVPKSMAVDKPLCSEIKDVCLSQQLGVVVEGTKLYSRELIKDHIHIGRVRVQLKNDDGSPLNANITSRRFKNLHNTYTSLPYMDCLFTCFCNISIISFCHYNIDWD